MIVITGATGALGSRIVAALLRRLPAESVGVSVRNPEKATTLRGLGVRVAAGDFTEPESLASAFDGADQVLVVSASIRGAGAVDANLAAIDAAHASGASRVVYTSHQAASTTSLFAPQQTHAATEAHLATLGAPYAALRNGFYASTLDYFVPAALDTGLLMAPADGPVSWTDHTDLADAAAAVLLDDVEVQGASAPLTAPEEVDFDAIARVLTELTGRRIERITMDDGEWKAAGVERGMPPEAADFTLGMFRAARAGEFAAAGPALAEIIGRRPRSVRSRLEEMVRTR